MSIVKRLDFADRLSYAVQRESDNGVPESASFQVVTDPATPFSNHSGTGKVTVHQAFSPFGWNESTEPAFDGGGTGYYEPSEYGPGAEHWFAWAFRVPTGWQAPNGFGLVLQFYSIIQSSPSVGGPSLEASLRGLGAADPNTGKGWRVMVKAGGGPSVADGLLKKHWYLDLAADTWYRVVMNVRWSPWGRANEFGIANTEPAGGTYQRTCGRTNGSPNVTLTADSRETGAGISRIKVGMGVTGTGIPANTTVISVNSLTSITLSNNATATGSATLTFTIGAGHLHVWVMTDADAEFAQKISEPNLPTLQKHKSTSTVVAQFLPQANLANLIASANDIKCGLYRKSRCKTQKEGTGSGSSTQIGPLKAGTGLSTSPTGNRCFYGAHSSNGPSVMYQGGVVVCTTEAEAFAEFGEATVAVAAVTNLAAVAGDTESDLSWTNPAGFDSIIVRRATGGYPASATDGTSVFAGTGTSVNDDGLTNDTPYFYSVFTELDGVFSSAAQVTATPTGGGGGDVGTNPTLLADLTALSGSDVRYGNTTVYGTRASLSANRKRLTKVTVEEELDVHTLWYWVEGFAAGTETIKLLVHDGDGTSGEPGSLTIGSAEQEFVASPFNGGWLKVTIDPAVTVAASEVWGGSQSEGGGVLTQAQETLSGASRSAIDTYSDGATDPAGAMSVFDSVFSFAIEGTPTGGGGTPAVTDDVAPSLVTARSNVSGGLISLVYDESLSTVSTPAAADFEVLADEEEQTVSTVTVIGDAVLLQLTAALEQGVTVTVSYTASSGPIEDVAGNNAANLVAAEVENQTQDVQTARRPGAFRIVNAAGRVEGERRVGEGGGG